MIVDAYAELPLDKLALAISSGLQAAQAAGRYDVQTTSDA